MKVFMNILLLNLLNMYIVITRMFLAKARIRIFKSKTHLFINEKYANDILRILYYVLKVEDSCNFFFYYLL